MSTQKFNFTVIAEFEVPTEHRQEFLELCRFDAERSLQDEAGCQQFDVNTSEDNPNLIALYEIYDDRAAFDVHTTMPHFATFSEGLERLGVQKIQVRFFIRQYP
jgi:quinol monooxygenase YgiN